MNFAARKILLNRDATKTLTAQLADALRSGIVRGEWAVGDALPGIYELAEECKVSAKVPRKALAVLASEGWTKPVRGVGSVVVDRDMAVREKGRVLFYVRETGYSYYCAEVMATFEKRLSARGYGISSVCAVTRSESAAVRRLDEALKEKWSLVVMMGGGAEARGIVAGSGWPFVLVGDGAPLPRFSAPSCIGRFEIRCGKAVPDLIRECVRRKVSRVVQFKYAEGAFDVAGMLTHAGIDVKTVNVSRKSSPEDVSRAALAEMRKIAAKRPLPDLFLFTDDYLTQGALIALSVASVRIPEDVAVVTHANKGLGPVWDKPLSRLEMDAASHADAVSRAVADYLKTGVHPPELDLGSVYKPGATF